MKVHNYTQWSMRETDTFRVIKTGRDNSARQHVVLRAHPLDPRRVISVRTSFSGSDLTITDESKYVWRRELASLVGFTR